ncbi:MAG: hypothetical protein H0V44_03515 [Planctomycetes bacterium]|nr:hypothetical protein [Planctomycetota bacterium]
MTLVPTLATAAALILCAGMAKACDHHEIADHGPTSDRAAHMHDNKVGSLRGKGVIAAHGPHEPVSLAGAPGRPATNDRASGEGESIADRHPDVGQSGAPALSDGIPVAVRATLRREQPDAEPSRLRRSSENGRIVYQARYQREGRDLELKVAEDGSIVWRNDLKEQARREENALREGSSGSGRSPEATQDNKPTADGAPGGDRDSGADSPPVGETPKPQDDPLERKLNESQARSADSSTDSTDQEEPPPTGKRLAIEQVPDAVKETIVRESAGLAITDIRRDSDDGRTWYRVKFRVPDGKDIKLKVAEDGTVISRK